MHMINYSTLMSSIIRGKIWRTALYMPIMVRVQRHHTSTFFVTIIHTKPYKKELLFCFNNNKMTSVIKNILYNFSYFQTRYKVKTAVIIKNMWWKHKLKILRIKIKQKCIKLDQKYRMCLYNYSYLVIILGERKSKC